MALARLNYLKLGSYFAAWIFALVLMGIFARYYGFFYESALFLSGYLDYAGNQDFSRIVLHVHRYDRMGYLGRELAYLMGYGDAWFIKICAQAGLPHFLSLTHGLSLLAITTIHGIFFRKLLPATPFIISLLLLLLFLTAPVSILSCGFCLPGQSAATVFAVLSLWTVMGLSSGRESVWASGIKMFFAALPLPFLGPQGQFFLMSMAGLATVFFMMGKRSSWLIGAWCALVAVGVAFAMHKFLSGPWLIAQMDGHIPRSASGSFNITRYLDHWCLYMTMGLQMLATTISRFFGGCGQWAGAAFAIAMVIPWFLKARNKAEGPLSGQHGETGKNVALIIVAGIMLLALMNSLIFSHRPDILRYSMLKTVRYWQIANGCVLVAASLSINSLLGIYPKARRVLSAVLCILVASNVYSIHLIAKEIFQETNRSYINRSHEAVECLRFREKPLFCFNLDQSEQDINPPPSGFFSDPLFNRSMRDLRPVYRVCRMLRAAPGHESSSFAKMERILAGQQRFVTLEPMQPMPWDTWAKYLIAAQKYDLHVVVTPPIPGSGISGARAASYTGIPLIDHIRDILPGLSLTPTGKCAGWFVITQDLQNKDIGLVVFLTAADEDAENLLACFTKNNISCRILNQDPFMAAGMDSYIEAGDMDGLGLFLSFMTNYAMLERRIGYFEGPMEGIVELGHRLLSQKDYPNAAMCLETAWAMRTAEARDISIAGGIYHSLGFPAKAHALLFEAIKTKPISVTTLNNLAWFLATTPDLGFADGEKAARIASALLETSPQNPSILDTLAAAQARTGRFPQAIVTARRSARLAQEQNDPEFLSEIENRIQLYQTNTPYLERRFVHGL